MSRKLRWGIVGCGDITEKRVAPAIKAHPECELAALCSGSLARAQELAESHGVDRAFDDLDAFLREDLDCVYVASRVFQHAEQAMAALRSGRHVLCEKPMALNTRECEAMLTAEAAAPGKLGVAYYHRFYPSWLRAKELAASGALGDVVAVRIMLSSFWRISPDDPKYWRVRRALSGGGPLVDIGTHRLDMLVDLLDEPEQVCAFMATRHHEWDVEDSCVIAMRMRNSVHAEAAVFGDVSMRRDEFEVLGTKGSVLLRPLGECIEVHRGGDCTAEELPLPENVHYPLVADFVRAVVENGLPACPGSEGIKTTRIVDAAIQSAEQCRVVSLSQI